MLTKKYLVYVTALISFLFMFSMNVTTAQKPSVTIIGAGLAGLTTAYKLYKEGYVDFDVYEARQRVGGRTFSVELRDETTGIKTYGELGGENIFDGGNAGNTRTLIDDLQLACIETTIARGTMRYYTGTDIIDPCHVLARCEYTPETLWDRLQQLRVSAQSMQDVLDGLCGENADLKCYLTVRLTCYEGGPPKELSSDYVTTLYYIMLGGLCSAHQEKSFIHYGRIDGGNNLITQRMAEKFAGHVHLGQALKKLYKTARGTYQLTFSTGLIIETDIVVLAIPASVYKDIEFGAEIIPQEMLNAIKNIRYGQHAKILLPVTRQEITQTFFTDYMAAWYGRHADSLTMFYCNERGHFTCNIISAIFNHDVSLMRMACDLPQSFATPVIAKDVYGVCYGGPVGYCWALDPYAQGTYSYIAAGQEEVLTAMQEHAGYTFRKLFVPLHNNTLFFAGEHTTVLLEAVGTMEAAVESGMRTAQSIVACYSN